MRVRKVIALVLAVASFSCAGDDVVPVDPHPSNGPPTGRPRESTGGSLSGEPAAPRVVPPKPTATAKPDPDRSATPAPSGTRAESKGVPADLESSFAAARAESPPGQATLDLVVAASARMRTADPATATAIGDRLEAICHDLYFGDAVVPGMESLGLRRYAVKKGDSPWKIAKPLGVDHGLLARLNPTAEPTKLRVGQRLKVLDLSSAEIEIVIDTAQNRLSLFRLPADGGGAQLLLHAPAACGGPKEPTPKGATKIRHLTIGPQYVDRKTGKTHGPDDAANPWGAALIALDAEPLDHESLAIHGHPGAAEGDWVGKKVTDRDVWLRNSDLERLALCVREGTKVVLR